MDVQYNTVLIFSVLHGLTENDIGSSNRLNWFTALLLPSSVWLKIEFFSIKLF